MTFDTHKRLSKLDSGSWCFKMGKIGGIQCLTDKISCDILNIEADVVKLNTGFYVFQSHTYELKYKLLHYIFFSFRP